MVVTNNYEEIKSFNKFEICRFVEKKVEKKKKKEEDSQVTYWW